MNFDCLPGVNIFHSIQKKKKTISITDELQIQLNSYFLLISAVENEWLMKPLVVCRAPNLTKKRTKHLIHL